MNDSLQKLARDALPDSGGALRLLGLDGPVEIVRDALGVPHVRARTTHDAFFAQGFVHAQDRLWQMEYDRMRAAGRAAKHVGRNLLKLDVFARRLGLVAAARADYETLDAEARAPLEAYAAGVNASIDSARALPVELALLGVTPEPWQPWDSAAVLKVRHVLMGSMHAKLWRARLIRAMGRDALAIGSSHGREDTLIVPVGARMVWRADQGDLHPGALALDALGDGSNNWAVHGSRTASGLPLLAGDPHRILEVPNVYYQNHVAGPEFDAIGLSMPGVPGLFHFGHNGTVAWCITHAMADTQDLYVERFDAEGRFEHRGEWVPAERRTEVIDVRGEAPERVDVTVTAHGPVLFGDPASGSAVTMRWTGVDRANDSLGVIVPMLRARSVEELDATMREWVDPCNNLVMADRAGTIGYLHRGRVPVRSRANAWTPVPGWTGEHEWDGDVRFDELPRLRNPETGFIVTANNRVCDADYPHYLGMDYSTPARADRIIERLRSLDAATAADMAAIHGDNVSISSRVFVEAVAKAAARGGRAAELAEQLSAWDGRMEVDAVGASIYAAVREELAGVLLEGDALAGLEPNPFPEDPMPSPAHTRIRAALPRLMISGDTSALGGRTWDEVVAEAVERAARSIESALGPDVDQWRWGRLHLTQTRHPLARAYPDAAELLSPKPVSIGGEGEAVLASTTDVGLGVLHSSVARYVFDLGDWDNSAWVVPLGSSGHPASAHYADQQQAWSSVTLKPMTYSWDRIEAESRQALEPR